MTIPYSSVAEPFPLAVFRREDSLLGEFTMKKHLLFSVAAVLLSFSALAVNADEGKKADKTATPKEIKCSVMSDHIVKVADATKLGAGKGYADYKGNRYFFCCAGCPSAFAKDPAKFAKADHIPTPKDGKKAAKKA
jgi:hypothetical protein